MWGGGGIVLVPSHQTLLEHWARFIPNMPYQTILWPSNAAQYHQARKCSLLSATYVAAFSIWYSSCSSPDSPCPETSHLRYKPVGPHTCRWALLSFGSIDNLDRTLIICSRTLMPASDNTLQCHTTPCHTVEPKLILPNQIRHICLTHLIPHCLNWLTTAPTYVAILLA